MDRSSTTPQIGMVIKVLASLGKKLAIVPIEQESTSERYQAAIILRWLTGGEGVNCHRNALCTVLSTLFLLQFYK
jgi:hypothetical protein